MSRLVAALAVFLCATVAQAQTYDSAGRLKTTAEVTNTSATVSPVASRLTDGTGFIVPVLDTTLTARFPVGSTPADNESNAVTITRSGAFMFVYDGATWDRWTGAVSGTVTANAGTNLNTSSLLTTAAHDAAFGTAGAADAQVRSVQGIAGGTALPISSTQLPAALDSTGRLDVNIGSADGTVTTSSNQGSFPWLVESQRADGDVFTGASSKALTVAAFYDTSPPSIADGSLGALRMTSARALMVDASATTQPISGTVQPGNTPNTTPWLTSINDGTNTAAVLNLAANDPLSVAIVDGTGSQITSFGGGVQYTEGNTDASITGTAVMWEDTGDALAVASAAKPLPVNVVAGGAGDGAIQDGASPSIEATVLDFTNSNPLAVRLTDTNGDYVGAGAGTQYADGASVATPTGTVALGHDGSNVRAITTDSAGDLQVDLKEYPAGQKTMSLSLPVVVASDNIVPTRLSQTSTDNDVNLTDGVETALISAAGALTVDGSGVTQPVSGSVTSAPALSAAALPVRPVNSSRTASGTLGALNDTVAIAGEGASAVTFEIDAGLTGTLTFEATLDGTNWFVARAHDIVFPGGWDTSVSTGSLPFRGSFANTGFAQYRIRVSAYTSGSSAARMSASAAVGSVIIGGGTLDFINNFVGVVGSKSNNNAAPTQLLGTLSAVANAAAPTYTEGNAVMPRTQLDGDLVVALEDELPAGTQTIGSVKLNDGTDTALVSGSGSLQVTCDNCGGSTFADDDAFTGGTTAVVPFAALYDTSPPAITDGSAGAPRMTSTRALMVDGSAVTQPVSGTFWQATQPVSGTFWQATQPVSIAAAVTVAQATAANLNATVTDGSGPLTVDGTVTANQGGAPWSMAISQTTTNNDVDVTTLPNVTIGTFPDNEPFNLGQIAGAATAVSNGTAATALRVTVASDSTGTLGVAGTAAHDGTTLPNPVGAGAFAETPEDSDANTNANRVSADADLVRLAADRNGTLYVRNGPPHRWAYHENSSSALTDTTVHASCGTGLYNYVESITASTGGATAFSILIEDSTTTTILGPYYLEAVAGRGLSVVYPGGRKQSTAATLISVTTTGAVAHGIDITGFCAP